MIKRVTIELDEEILEEAKKALGQPTMRATVEEALSRAINQAEVEVKERRARQLEFLKNLDKHIDLEVLKSGEMWRRGAGRSEGRT